ncbi:hypothetical protein LEP3755_36750 [Leptolyngbya sp. NIES-3755]|nr:hypothetical protein LEP3755_36750 [Leptolyngbya sp. NIES-3755]
MARSCFYYHLEGTGLSDEFKMKLGTLGLTLPRKTSEVLDRASGCSGWFFSNRPVYEAIV